MILTLAALCALAQTPRAIVRGTGPLACPAVGVCWHLEEVMPPGGVMDTECVPDEEMDRAMEREREWP
jgi:hypothetical protein